MRKAVCDSALFHASWTNEAAQAVKQQYQSSCRQVLLKTQSLKSDQGFVKDLMCTGKMAQWVTELAAEPDNPSVISGMHIVEEKNQLLQVIL